MVIDNMRLVDRGRFLEAEARAIESAVERTVASCIRTADIAGPVTVSVGPLAHCESVEQIGEPNGEFRPSPVRGIIGNGEQMEHHLGSKVVDRGTSAVLLSELDEDRQSLAATRENPHA